jgi:hypothetical protein
MSLAACGTARKLPARLLVQSRPAHIVDAAFLRQHCARTDVQQAIEIEKESA